MRKGWKEMVALAAIVAVPSAARAHAFVCEKTVALGEGRGGAEAHVHAYPATLRYDFAIANTHPTEVSIIEGLVDPMFPEGLGVALPFPIPLGGSTSASKTVTVESYEDCLALEGRAEGEAATGGDPITITNTLTVVFDGEAAAWCSAQVICHPPEPPPPGDGCLTRTAGYWSTHPDVTREFLPVESCDRTLGNVGAGEEGSILEDLCSVGTDAALYGSPQEAQLVRQCAAAALNVAASEALGGSCGGFSARFAACCTACGAPGEGCIEDVDAFNNSSDTLLEAGAELELCHVLDLPCAAAPAACQEASGNGIVDDREGGGSSALAAAARWSSRAAQPTSGGCAGGPGGLLALLAVAGLVPLLRRR